jgi:tRNA(Ile)-lysidine synthase
MPILKTYNPNLVGTLTRTAELLQSEDEYLQHLAAEELAKISRKTDPDAQEFVINTQGLIELNPVLGRRVIRQWVGSELDYAGVQRIWELACRGRTGAIAELPGARQVHKNYTELVLSNQSKQLDPISKDTKKANLGWPVIINGLLELPQYKLHLRTVVVPKQKGQLIGEKGKCSPEQGQTNCYLAWDLTQGIPVLRQRQPGDWIQFPFGKKKLKQWLIDQKIPLIERDKLLILAWGQQILWIPGLLFGQSPFGERQAETYLHLTIQSSMKNDM